MSQPLIEVEGLVVTFPGPGGDVRAVDRVDLTLRAGRSLGLVGESGCGKSTLARALVGLVRPEAGSISIGGEEVEGFTHKQWMPFRRRIQLVFQDAGGSLDPRRTIGDALREPLDVHRIGKARERRLRSLALLDAAGLHPRHLNRFPHELSGGQRQRAAIARSLMLEPDVLVLDEPTSALDVSIQAQVLNLLRTLRGRFGLTYLFISHDLAVVRTVCEEVAVMYLGRIVEVGQAERLFDIPKHPYTRALLAAVPPPDPVLARAREHEPLRGEVPSPLAPPPGCHFHPRCPERDAVAGDRCATEEPALRAIGDSLACACHLYDRSPVT